MQTNDNPDSSKNASSSVTWLGVAPALFVLLWSTGFVGTKYGIPYAEPFSFLFSRMVLVVCIITLVAVFTRAPWPKTPLAMLHIAVAGLLVHAAYLIGVLYATKLKLPIGFIALIAGLQPILTAWLASQFFGERLQKIQWLGMAMGFTGVMLVVASKTQLGTMNWAGLGFAAMALVGITLGTLYQKRFCADMDLRTGGAVQYAATAILAGLLMIVVDTKPIQWTGEFIFALVWLAVVLSLAAIGLLYLMIRHGATAKVASLFFLTPSVTAIMAFLLFNESLNALAIGGLLVSAIGVALVIRK
jgi:drug/metabolite transporter (DMT)-like permease